MPYHLSICNISSVVHQDEAISDLFILLSWRIWNCHSYMSNRIKSWQFQMVQPITILVCLFIVLHSLNNSFIISLGFCLRSTSPRFFFMGILALLGLLFFHIIRIHLQVPIFNWDCIKFIDFFLLVWEWKLIQFFVCLTG